MLKIIRNSTLSFCVIGLISVNANAGFLDELQNVMNQVQKGQQNSNNSSVQAQETISETQEQTTPTFNSLADEEAYKKKQQMKEQQKTLDLEQNFKQNIIPKIEQIESLRFQFYKKYYVRDNDTLDSIDSKFKNRIQLFQEMQQDINVHDTEVKNLQKIFDNNQHDPEAKVYYANMLTAQKMTFPDTLMDGLLRSPLSSVKDNSGNNYLWYDAYPNFSTESYVRYLKDAYSGYDNRQKEKENNLKAAQAQAKAQKDAQAQQALWLKENKKVRGICNAWIAKAHKMVYSLGVGDRITQHGVHLVIQRSNANTFLVNKFIIGPVYIQKRECLPDPMLPAPSQYCQQAE
ncbi:MAG: hypothetical protein PHX13_07755 [Thiovulaceae bacterium]|nr:hypothetical protein [Sulfurimonadaceae bacterium]